MLTTLANFGGMGALCAVLFVLLRETIRTFKEEMGAERAACERRHVEVIDELRESRSSNETLHKQLDARLVKLDVAAEFNRMLMGEIQDMKKRGHGGHGGQTGKGAGSV